MMVMVTYGDSYLALPSREMRIMRWNCRGCCRDHIGRDHIGRKLRPPVIRAFLLLSAANLLSKLIILIKNMLI